MGYAQRLILHAPAWDSPDLEAFVEACIRDSVALICVWGEDASRVEDVIDELVVGGGSDSGRFIQTSAHPNDTLESVRRFAQQWTLDVNPLEPVQEVQLTPQN